MLKKNINFISEKKTFYDCDCNRESFTGKIRYIQFLKKLPEQMLCCVFQQFSAAQDFAAKLVP